MKLSTKEIKIIRRILENEISDAKDLGCTHICDHPISVYENLFRKFQDSLFEGK